MSIADEIKQSFKSGSSLTKLIYINLAVFLVVKLIAVFYFLLSVENSFSLVSWLAVPADLSNLAYKPWTVFSYMFLHQDFLHILFNMLWLYWFGQIFLHYFDNKKLLSVYLVGGLAGAFVYILTFNIFPVFADILPVSYALGASASVIAIVIAVSVYAPNHTIYLLFFGPVKLKYIALATIIIDVISIASTNAGGHLAHLGGALFGYFYIMQFKKGRNITRLFDRFMDFIFSIFKPRPKIKVTYKRPVDDFEYNKSKAQKQAEIDKILDKIAKSGYESLSKQEKETLFKNSK
ncbi:MAG: rhomboid family intramembrane serine protease [Bacteroidetes bacterium GWC2_33_15]|nr:MAG: rhomboid family intramembrane serine protease [Bacteroidetes bacterium GWA2_33_15]OFX52585.1 MAG: rhomboid family intramembrane serine protease [Bacteroidetes bacterium GWC2_33_15]OFX63930.1 MAG: rhomboid family intramembrane serine protease [Bacteroidetes bacterium GWB2_32_14]OFX70803.1 MAG: rhomboid family intramembrane serine protease [Bacteroidetes bacterium GWD2_33_33]HAN19931.1 rhomboid family intramembrane serine protease [Bacteroidales bacterium]